MRDKNIEKKYKIIFENAGIPIYTISKDGRILEANKAAAELFETDLDNLIGKKIEDFYFNKDDRKAFLERLKKEKRLTNYHIKFKTAKNKIIDVFANVVLWDEEDESDILHYGTFINITDILNLSQKIKNLRLAKYNTNLAKNYLSDLNKNLLKLLELNSLSQLKDKDDIYLTESEQILEKQLNTLNKYKSLFPDEDVIKKEIDIVNFILEHNKLFKEMLPENIKINFSINSGKAVILADYTQLLQIFTSIIINSAEAIAEKNGEKGEIKITVNEKYIENSTNLDNGNYVEIIIEDNGIGIKETDIPKLFAGGFTTKYKKAKGLSLPVIKSIVSFYGGDITIESTYNVGTKVTILLPLANYEKEENIFNESAFLKDVDNQKTIFFVDDDDILREAFALNLQNSGFNVIEAGSPNEALEKLNDYYPLIDIALIDVKMPGMSGGNLYNEIIKRFGHLPVIFISGYKDTEEIRNLKKNYSFIHKPFSTDDLVREINKNLSVDDKWKK